MDGGKLTPDDLGRVLEEVHDESARWYQLGLQLLVKTGTLDSIRLQFSDPRDQLLEMLKTWLKTDDCPSRKTLINALRSQSVVASQLAGVLETKYFPVDMDRSSTSASENQPETKVIHPSPMSGLVVPRVTPKPRVADMHETTIPTSDPAIVTTHPRQPTTAHGDKQSTQSSRSHLQPTPKTITCSACAQEGHTRRSKNCPAYNGEKCKCGEPVIRNVAKSVENKGKIYYACSKKVDRCDYFRFQGQPLCKCGIPTAELTVGKDNANKGRKFYKCRKRKCDFFQWQPIS